jgi:hypothetical protein
MPNPDKNNIRLLSAGQLLFLRIPYSFYLGSPARVDIFFGFYRAHKTFLVNPLVNPIDALYYE